MNPPSTVPSRSQLDKAFVGGLAWTAGSKWVTQLVTWLSVFISARLLSPSDFGTMEMAAYVATFASLLAEFGIGTAVLQMHELDSRILAQLNTISVVFYTIMLGFAASIAPLVATFFRSEQITLPIIVYSLGFAFTAFQAVPQGLLQRDMDYRRLSLAEATQAIVQAVVTVAGAFSGMGYWALVAGQMAGRAAATVLVVFWKPVPFALPRWKQVSAPMRFGFSVAVDRLAWTAYSLADGVIVGRILGQSPLGVYRLAMNLASAPAEKISMLLMRVTGPLLAKVQHDHSAMKRYFLFISDALALSIFPLVFGLAAIAPEAITVTVGRKWAGAIVPLQWLAVFMAFRTLNSLMGQVLTSLRRAAYLMWVSLFTAIVMTVSFLVAARWGISAVAAAWIVMSPVTMLPPAIKLFRLIQCGLREYLAILSPPAVASAVMLCAVFGLKRWLLPVGLPPLWSLVAQVTAGAAVYMGVLLSVYRPVVMRYVQFVQHLRDN